MITTNKLKTILYKIIKESPLNSLPEIKKNKHRPVTKENVDERVVIVVNGTGNSSWQETYAHVCVYIPDILIMEAGVSYNEQNSARLEEIEGICKDMFAKITLLKDGVDTIYYEAETIQEESDPETWSHFINVRLKITNTNFKL